MSYSLIGHFVDVKNKKRIVSAELGFMKNLNSRRYSADFDGIESTSNIKDSEYPEITQYVSTEFHDYYRPELIEENNLNDKFIIGERNGNKEAYIFDENFIEENAALFEKYVLDINDDPDSKRIFVYSRKIKNNTGIWYKLSDFTQAEPILKKEYEELKRRIEKLESMKDTKEWFEMSESAKNSFYDELGYAKDDLEEIEWKYYAIQKMNNILDFISEDVGFQYTNDVGETRYIWNYDDDREIEVYIEVD